MRYGLNVINAYPAPFYTRLARAAAAAGWDGIFLWDHLTFGGAEALEDPWVLLGAMAASAPGLTLGPLVTPLPRRRPQVVAKHVATLDALTEGRAVFGVGLGGVEREFSGFGEESAPKVRAARLDEALAVLQDLWSGQPVHHDGAHYHVDGITLLPRPVQQPRIPIWVGGNSRAALRRAARWDGWVPPYVDLDEVAAGVAYLRRIRRDKGPFEVVFAHDSRPPRHAAALVRQAAQSGITWWLEAIHGYRFADADAALDWVAAGPPREDAP